MCRMLDTVCTLHWMIALPEFCSTYLVYLRTTPSNLHQPARILKLRLFSNYYWSLKNQAKRRNIKNTQFNGTISRARRTSVNASWMTSSLLGAIVVFESATFWSELSDSRFALQITILPIRSRNDNKPAWPVNTTLFLTLISPKNDEVYDRQSDLWLLRYDEIYCWPATEINTHKVQVSHRCSQPVLKNFLLKCAKHSRTSSPSL